MNNVSLVLPDRSGALATMGEALGRAGTSVEEDDARVVDAAPATLERDGPKRSAMIDLRRAGTIR